MILEVIEILKYFLIKKDMASDLNMSYGKMSDFVSFPLFGFPLAIKLRNFNFEGNQNVLMVFDKKMMSDLNLSCQTLSDLV